MLRNIIHIVWFTVAFVSSAATQTVGQPVDAVTGVLEHAGISERIGEQADLEARFIDETGKSVRFGDYFDGERPVILTFVYHECPMLCSLVLEGLTKSMKEIEWHAGDQYEAVTISISPSETPDQALRQKDRYVSRLGYEEASSGWHFLTGEEDQINAITVSAGFLFDKDVESGEYGHAAVVILLSPQGIVTRYLYGITYAPFDLRAGLVEASEGRVGSVVDRLIMFCFQYDPVEGSYVANAWLAMRLAGGMTLLLLVGLLTMFWRRERASQKAGPASEGENQEGSDE